MKANLTLKTFLQSEWDKLKVVSQPTATRGKVKEFNGEKYEWVGGGKRVSAKLVP